MSEVLFEFSVGKKRTERIKACLLKREISRETYAGFFFISVHSNALSIKGFIKLNCLLRCKKILIVLRCFSCSHCKLFGLGLEALDIFSCFNNYFLILSLSKILYQVKLYFFVSNRQ